MPKPIMLSCPCGNDLETDSPVETASTWPCGRCGQVAWKVRQASTMAKDPTAALELKKGKNKKQEDPEE